MKSAADRTERATRRRWRGLAKPSGVALLVLLCLAGCGAESTTKGITARPTATASPSPAASPTPVSFPLGWQAAAGLPATIGGYAFAQSAPQTGYACALPPNAGFWATQDGGDTWASIATTNLAISSDGCGVSVDPANPQDVFAWDSVILSRSRDGGHTWVQLAGLVGQSGPSEWRNATAIGARIIAVGVPVGPGEGAGNTSDLYASDDSGQTWHTIGQSILAKQLNVGNFVTVGTTLYVSGYPLCAGGLPIDGCNGDATARVPGALGSAAPLALPLSGDRQVPYEYFASADGGATFNEMTVPGSASLSELSFAPKSGGGYYGVVLSTAGDLTTTVYWSNDSGRTWQPMPRLDSATPGKPDPRTLGILGRLVACPDGTIVAGTWRDRTAQDGGADVGFFQLPGGIVFAHWQPLATGGFYKLQAIPRGGGFRLWALPYTQSLWQSQPQGGAALESVTFLAAK